MHHEPSHDRYECLIEGFCCEPHFCYLNAWLTRRLKAIRIATFQLYGMLEIDHRLAVTMLATIKTHIFIKADRGSWPLINGGYLSVLTGWPSIDERNALSYSHHPIQPRRTHHFLCSGGVVMCVSKVAMIRASQPKYILRSLRRRCCVTCDLV